jgi:hypothetical protein
MAALGTLGKTVAPGAAEVIKTATGKKQDQSQQREKKQDQSQQREKKQAPPKQELDLSPKFANRQQMPSMKRGGRVKRTGPHLLHKGEFVVPAKQASRKASTHKRSIVKL